MSASTEAVQRLLDAFIDGDYILIRFGEKVDVGEHGAIPVVLNTNMPNEDATIALRRIAESLSTDGYMVTPDVEGALSGALIQPPAGG